ncbi:hypothetical protein SARC_01188 [Sphaeroforma arctica JP610]|uniref:C2H2-type domain-containing protein n=1 Tax=Sphaeroforma arctica JP610 TaxID=667725 RepID=A0A0L0GCE7_9EUKA|nr:hypothetical protein SARC_01188 [Sphaeroforma arctica JP610]KNC86682.1 hypothetical protein SARC_01188 [Sphaeroforma arctica JP610]|eukprot:XP_014160584.1 hypothetical protein SARC_01188 [Sphaeroforma arctica JP610]
MQSKSIMQSQTPRQAAYSIPAAQSTMVGTPTQTMMSGSGHVTPVPGQTHAQVQAPAGTQVQSQVGMQNIAVDGSHVMGKVNTIDQITQGYTSNSATMAVQGPLPIGMTANTPMYYCQWGRCGAMFSKVQELNDHNFFHEQERQRQQRQQQQQQYKQPQQLPHQPQQHRFQQQPSTQRQSSTQQHIGASTYAQPAIVPDPTGAAYAHASVPHDFYRGGGYSDGMYVAPPMQAHPQATPAQAQAQAHVWHQPQVQVQQQARPLSVPVPVSGQTTFPCLWEKCGQVFMSQAALQSHSIVHTGAQAALSEQAKTENGEGSDPFTCTWEQGCQKKFATIEQYNQHMFEHSSYADTNANNITKCTHPGCRKTFIRKADMEAHRDTHSKDFPHECPIPGCDKKFNHKGSLNIHIRTHTQDKRYVCTWEGCEKRFLHRGNLNSHLRTHSGEKPHQCTWEGCTKRFQHKGNLNTHLRRHAGNKPYECPEAGCDKKFTTHATMDYHIRTHTGDHPFACTWRNCMKRFITKGNLNVHMRTHTGDKPYRCAWDKCKKCFSTQASLDYHIKTHNKRAEGLAASVSTTDAAALIMSASATAAAAPSSYMGNMGTTSNNSAPTQTFF